MKNRFFTGSSNCCDSVMFPSRSAMAPATAATMPGRSGQAKVTTQCVIVLSADKSVVTLTRSRLVVEAAGNQKPAARVAETKSPRLAWRKPKARGPSNRNPNLTAHGEDRDRTEHSPLDASKTIRYDHK